MDDQRARVADIGQMREQFQVLDQRDASLIATGQAKGEDRASAFRAIKLGQIVVLVAHKAGIGDPFHSPMGGQMLGHRQRIVAMALHAQRQSLDAGQDQKGVERRQGRAKIAQAEHPASDGKGEIAKSLAQNHAVIFGPGRRQHGIALVAHEIERAAIDNDARNRIAVATEEFGGGMHDDVGAMLERTDEVGRGQGIVDDEGQLVLLGNRRNRRQIGDDAAGIGDGFNENRLGAPGDRRLEAGEIVGVGPFHSPAEILVGMVELVDRAAIQFCGGDKFIPRLHQRVKHQMLRGMARGHRQRRRAALKGRNPFLQHRIGRVGDAGVDIAKSLQAKQRGGMIDIIEHESRGLVDWRRPRAGCRVGLGTGVDGKRVEAGGCRGGHEAVSSSGSGP